MQCRNCMDVKMKQKVCVAWSVNAKATCSVTYHLYQLHSYSTCDLAIHVHEVLTYTNTQ